MKPYSEVMITIQIPKCPKKRAEKLKDYFEKKYDGAYVELESTPKIDKPQMKDVFYPASRERKQCVNPQTGEEYYLEGIDGRALLFDATKTLENYKF